MSHKNIGAKNDGLMKIVADHNEVEVLFRQFSNAEDEFMRKWGAIAPCNPVAEGFAATILDIFDGQKFIMVDYKRSIVYPFTVVGSVVRQDSPQDQLVVTDRRGTMRSLEAIGITPRADNDRWHPGRLTVVDEFENVRQLAEFLYSLETDAGDETAESLAEYARREYWADFPYLSYDDEELPSLFEED